MKQPSPNHVCNNYNVVLLIIFFTSLPHIDNNNNNNIGRSYRHTAITTIIQKALSAGNIPSHLEPSRLYRSDGKCPDGITIAPWERGHTLI